jgi:hypothetical protein
MNLSQKQRKVSLALITDGYIVNWFQHFGKPVLTIYLNENDEERLKIKFSADNIYYDFSIEPHLQQIQTSDGWIFENVSKSKKFLLIKAFSIIDKILPENNNPELAKMRKFESEWITPGYIDAQED